MGKFNRSNYRDRDNRSNFRDKQMHDAVCADCGNNCQVPFRPTGGKPIYCGDCFRNHRDEGAGRNDRRGGDRRNFKPSRHSDGGGELKSHMTKLEAKLDMIIRLLESERTSQKKNEKSEEQKVEKKESEKPTKKIAKKTTKKPTKKSAPKKKTTKKKAAAKKK